jgi:hypothetical protein
MRRASAKRLADDDGRFLAAEAPESGPSPQAPRPTETATVTSIDGQAQAAGAVGTSVSSGAAPAGTM